MMPVDTKSTEMQASSIALPEAFTPSSDILEKRRSSRISRLSYLSQLSIESSIPRSGYSSSLELRRLPVDDLLIPPEPLRRPSSSNLEAVAEEVEASSNKSGNFFFSRTCINSKFRLKTQLILSFGTINALTIFVVTAACIFVGVLSGNFVKGITRSNYSTLAQETEGTTARFLAEALSSRLIPTDIVEIIAEAVQDRFVGYPDHPGDELVPFWDVESQSNRYPIIGQPIPLDWQIRPNVDNENQMEHVQNRWGWYDNFGNISTRTAFYSMQGMCDPSVTDPAHATYFHNCTNENNNIEKGGVVAPTTTNYQIHRKASDLTPLLKALYEYHREAFLIGVYFANEASGASLTYPHIVLNSTIDYESIGCDWLIETPHPLNNSRTIMEGDHIRQKIQTGDACRPSKTNVSSRRYNPMERAFCRDQAINPHKVHVTDPYLNAWSPTSLISLGKAIYDKSTSEFIGCISVDFVSDSFEQIIHSSRLSDTSHVSIVRFSEVGTVFVSTAWPNVTMPSTTVTIDEIDVGVRQSTYQLLRSLVNYSDYGPDGNLVWNATKVKKKYVKFQHDDIVTGYHVSGYPIPPPPEVYDPDYIPEFLSIVTVPINEVYEDVDPLLEQVDVEVQGLVVTFVIVGLIGLGIVVVIIVLVSHMLTSQLQYVNEVANDILTKNFGDNSGTKQEEKNNRVADGIVKTGFSDMAVVNNSQLGSKNKKENSYLSKKFKEQKWAPRTEIDDVVEKFQKMVSHFTGGSMAKSIKGQERELRNGFTAVKYFKKLYLGRQEEEVIENDYEGSNDKKIEATTKFQYTFNSGFQSGSMDLLHFGTNANKNQDLPPSMKKDNNRFMGKKKAFSALFFWIVTLMVTPFLLTTAVMTGLVSTTIFNEFHDITDEIKNSFLDYKVNALNIFVQHRAYLVSAFMERPVRDLHVHSRYAEWLLFNGITRAESFTEMLSNIEECKIFPNAGQCEKAMQERTCDCAWSDERGTCHNYTNTKEDSRYLQKSFFVSQSQDTWPNGDRNFTTYPNASTSANNTVWWDDVTTVPGSEEGSLASGHRTTYARLRALSASPISYVLYNKDSGNKRIHLGAYIGLEADGTFFGYSSCEDPPHAQLAHFRQSLENENLRPELCPAGKYGFDPRCREWYSIGKEKKLHVSPPYNFANGNSIGQTCTSQLIDPMTGEHVGQTLVDFIVNPVNSSFYKKHTPLSEGGFWVLITASSDVNDTILGPDLFYSHLRPVADDVFANDPDCNQNKNCTNRQMFQPIVDAMKLGQNGTTNFKMGTEGGVDTFHIAYAPVAVSSNSPVNSSDFSRGVKQSDELIYSLALVEREGTLLRQLDEMQRHLNRVTIIALAVLILMVCVAVLFVTYISYHIALSVSDPMLYLLDIIGYINRLESHGDTPDIDTNRRGHAQEVVNVSNTIESLYTVIRCANVAFFAGDIKRAFSVLTNVLEVYRGLNNEKGISIACNNLGNTMLAVYRTMEDSEKERFCGFTKRQIITMGLRYFHESIQLGEKAYDAFYQTQGWSPDCLEFMQHLSNRYFNRAIFLLTVKDNHSNPKEIEELGFRDLQIAHDMDCEIVDEGGQAGWTVRTIDMHFNVMLCRIRGHLLLQEIGYPDDFVIKEVLDDAFKIIGNEMENKPGSSMLFSDMSCTGRMQQIETELMRYNMLIGDIETAAKIAIRMLVEDEYILLDAQRKAVEILINYIDSPELTEDSSKAEKARVELHEYQQQLEESETLLMERSMQKTSSTRSTVRASFNSFRNLHVRESNLGVVTMEAF